ncbi:hypothetical protein [Acinetobacter guillouiae]|uniref:hypothetical protein n=1 Tax=Acinetobacter guillouiae TaxID=106649 RepID=UPI001CD3F531|nr:hypothetical protein [Acinetobacter guillouiae]
MGVVTITLRKDDKELSHSPINRYIKMRLIRATRITDSNNSIRENGPQPIFTRGSIEARMQSENLGIVFLD